MEFVVTMMVLVIVCGVAAMIAIGRRSRRGPFVSKPPDASHSVTAHAIRDSQNQAGGV